MTESAAPAWSHFNPVRVLAGAGVLGRLPDFVRQDGKVLLVTTAGFTRRGVCQPIVDSVGKDRVLVFDRVMPNPQLDDLEQAIDRFRPAGIAQVIALGGGSVIDAAKVLAVSLPAGLAQLLTKTLREQQPHTWTGALPLVAIPTTSGTGAEVTPFATVWDKHTHRKHSLSGDHLYPSQALLDPSLTLTLPHEETLHTALDATSHALESLWNKNRTPISAACSFQALAFILDALPAVLKEPGNLRMRADMQHASLLAGVAISQTRTAIAHSISYPLTSRFGVPHGLACSFTLPQILRTNLENVATSQYERTLLSSVLKLLESLGLPERLKRYVSKEAVLSVQGEMITRGRMENFAGRLEGELVDLIGQTTV